jgi:hypothetical protein
VSPGSGWAIGGWFIPLANYIIPELQLFRSAAASDPDAAPPAGRAPQVVVAWWVLWATGALLFAVGRSMHPSGDVTFGNLSDKADQFANGDRVMAVGLLLTAAAAVLAMVMVRTLSARQELALSRRGSQPPQPWQQQPQQPWQQPAQPQSWQQPQAWPPQPQPQPQSWQPQPPPQQWPPAPQPPAQQWPPAPQPQPPPPPQQWPPASPPPDPSVPS